MNNKSCPFCGLEDLQQGEIGVGSSSLAHFAPNHLNTKRFVMTMKLLTVEVSREAVMCLECGKVWASADPFELKKLIAQHTRT